jgi:hypothetical protein
LPGSDICSGPCEKRAATVIKLRTFEMAFNSKGIRLDGYEKPINAQPAKIINIPPAENIEYLVIKTCLDTSRRDKVKNTAINKGMKKMMISILGAFI